MGSRSKKTAATRRKRQIAPGLTRDARPATPQTIIAGGGDATQDVFLQRIARRCKETTQKSLQKTPDLRSLHGVVTDCTRLFDDTVREIDFTPRIACKRGCSYCCFNQVSLSQPEALFLGIHLLENFTEERLCLLEEELTALVLRVKGMTRAEIGMIRHEVPCILLENGACSVHTGRPFACRGWNSVNVANCRDSVEQRNPMLPVENHGLMREIAEHIQLGLLQGAHAAGLEAGYLLLPRALLLMLQKGVLECTTNWLQGKTFFRSE